MSAFYWLTHWTCTFLKAWGSASFFLLTSLRHMKTCHVQNLQKTWAWGQTWPETSKCDSTGEIRTALVWTHMHCVGPSEEGCCQRYILYFSRFSGLVTFNNVTACVCTTLAKNTMLNSTIVLLLCWSRRRSDKRLDTTQERCLNTLTFSMTHPHVPGLNLRWFSFKYTCGKIYIWNILLLIFPDTSS